MEEWDALLVVFRKSEGPSVVRASYSARELAGGALAGTTRLMLVAFNGFRLIPVAGSDCWSPTAENRSHSRPVFRSQVCHGAAKRYEHLTEGAARRGHAPGRPGGLRERGCLAHEIA